PGFGVGDGVRAEQVRGQEGEVAAAAVGGPPLEEQVLDERVLDVHEDGDRSIHRRQLLDRQHGHEETPARAPVFLGRLDAHEADLEAPLSNAGSIAQDRSIAPTRGLTSRSAKSRTVSRNSSSSSESFVKGGVVVSSDMAVSMYSTGPAVGGRT